MILDRKAGADKALWIDQKLSHEPLVVHLCEPQTFVVIEA